MTGARAALPVMAAGAMSRAAAAAVTSAAMSFTSASFDRSTPF
jgi:hypothetical protein